MNSKWNFNILFIAIILVSSAVLSTQQDQVCNLPDGSQSICERLHRCAPLWNLVKHYGTNTPAKVRSYISQHECASKSFVCCPGNKVSLPVTQAPLNSSPLETENFETQPISKSRFDVAEDLTCNLPNGFGQSSCIRLHYCPSLWNMVKQFGSNLPVNVQQNLKSHACATKNFFCCPDNATKKTIKSTYLKPVSPNNL